MTREGAAARDEANLTVQGHGSGQAIALVQGVTQRR